MKRDNITNLILILDKGRAMGLISGKINIFEKESIIFEGGDEVCYIAYISKGSVAFESTNDEFTHNEGEFICIKDLYNGFYSGDYTANAGCELLVIPADSPAGLYEFLTINPTIQSELSFEFCVLITKLYDLYQALYNDIEDFYSSIIAMHERYVQCCQKAKIEPTEFLQPHPADSYKFSAQDFHKNYIIFAELASSKPKAHTIFKANGEKFLKAQADLIRDIYTAYDDMVYYLKTIISLFASKSELCLFSLAAALGERTNGKYKSQILQLLNDMRNVITNIDSDIRNSSGLLIDIDYNRVNFYFMMVENMDEDNTSTEDDENADTYLASLDSEDAKELPSEINEALEIITDASDDTPFIDTSGTLRTLCTFAEFDDSKYLILDAAVLKFMSLPDKFSKEDDIRKFRKEFTLLFFELYEEVFVHYAKSNDKSELKLIKLFLDFGFLDERLLTDSQIAFLLSIPELNPSAPCKVYRMKDWLMRIYSGVEVASKNEFDMDYTDHIRERKKTEAITSTKERELLANNELKVRFEISNLVKYNMRLVNGNMLAFFPMLHMDCFEREIKNLLLTSEAINDTVNKLVAVDYSIFYREILYADEAKKIPKANIQKEIFPNIILFPTVGMNGIMWQETSGKRISSEGRFLLPALFAGKIEDVMLAMFGRFRFELCKTLYGSAWNNISIPSLTSEYCDYVQFYRKNKDLSTEKKEALKNQITRCRNNLREIFVYDYIVWIRYESAGAIRLNKISRRMLATYCPFSKDIRNKITGQPIFADAMTKYQREKNKKIKETNNLIVSLQRRGATITEEILETKHFYEDL